MHDYRVLDIRRSKESLARQQVAGLGTILSVWAHPDDESYLAGGVMAAAVDNGQRVVCLTATAHGSQATATSVRDAELTRALDVLGVEERIALSLPDGRCDAVPAEHAVETLTDVIQQVRPDTLLTFGPDGMTGHEDHKAVSRWVTSAVQRLSSTRPRVLQAAASADLLAGFSDIDDKYDVYFNGRPRHVTRAELAFSIEVVGDLLDRKVSALMAHRSQTRQIIDDLGPHRYAAWVAEEMYVDAADLLEA